MIVAYWLFVFWQDSNFVGTINIYDFFLFQTNGRDNAYEKYACKLLEQYHMVYLDHSYLHSYYKWR